MEEWGNEEGGGGDGRGKRENGRGWGELGERGVWGRWGVGGIIIKWLGERISWLEMRYEVCFLHQKWLN